MYNKSCTFLLTLSRSFFLSSHCFCFNDNQSRTMLAEGRLRGGNSEQERNFGSAGTSIHIHIHAGRGGYANNSIGWSLWSSGYEKAEWKAGDRIFPNVETNIATLPLFCGELLSRAFSIHDSSLTSGFAPPRLLASFFAFLSASNPCTLLCVLCMCICVCICVSASTRI